MGTHEKHICLARVLKTLLTDDGGIFSSRAIARTPNPLFFKSPTAFEYAFDVAGRPNLTPRFMAAARPALTRSRIIPRPNSATAISTPS